MAAPQEECTERDNVVNRDQVSRIERDEMEPRFSPIHKLAAGLEVDARELLDDD